MKSKVSYIHKFIRGQGKSTLLLLHGTGGDENDMISLGQEISYESSILSLRGKVLENGMPRFFKRIREGIFDLEDLKFRSRELADFVKESAAGYKFDLTSLVAVGYSNGANIAASMMLLQLISFAGAILFRPMVPLTPDRPPNLTGTHILVASGTNDTIVPKIETTRLIDLLSTSGAKVTLNWEPSGHGITQVEVHKAKEWFNSEFTRSPALN